MLTRGLTMLMVVQSSLGLLFPGQYRDVEWIKASWFGNDWVTLVVAVPLLVVARAAAEKGSIRALLLWLGVLAYAAYNYAFYLFGAALGTFFPIYVAAVVVSVLALIACISELDPIAVAARIRPTNRLRIIAGFLALVGVGLACVWLALWAAYAFAGKPTPGEPEAVKLVAALDLSMMATALTFGGVLLWRRRPWGFVIAPIAGIQASLYLLVLLVNSGVAILRGLASVPGEMPVWGTLAALTAIATVSLLRGVGNQAAGSVSLCLRGP